LVQGSTGWTVLQAYGQVCDPVGDRTIDAVGKTLQVVRVPSRRVYEVPVAALQGEALGECCEALDQGNDGRIDVAQIYSPQGLLAVLMEAGVVDECFRWSEGFQFFISVGENFVLVLLVVLCRK